MSTLSPSITIKEPTPGQGHGNGHPPVLGGGDGRDGGAESNYVGRLRRARVGVVVLMTPIVMLFVSFTSAYLVRQGLPTLDDRGGTYVKDWLQVNLPVALLLVNTVLLILSSMTVELARRQAKRQAALAAVPSVPGVSKVESGAFPWLGATVVLGLGFLVGQWMAWKELANRGFYLATSPSSSFVYLLTATHAIHLAGGLLVLFYANLIYWLHRPGEQQRIVVDVTAWYWHFMTVLWIYVFALLEFAR